MKAESFAYWLQGLFELANPKTLDEYQTEMIKRHLNLVFKHDIDPSMGSPEHQAELNKIHNGFGPNQTADYTKYCGTFEEHKEAIKFVWPTNDEEAIAKWGPQPSPKHVWNIHGWYDPAEGQPRC
jgi:hypothetical protein